MAWASLIVSILALFSGISAWFTLSQKKKEMGRALRIQFADIVGKLLAAEIEIENLTKKIDDETISSYERELSRSLRAKYNQTRFSLAHVGQLLLSEKPLSKTPQMISSIEWAALARALEVEGDLDGAAGPWKKAVEFASQGIPQAMVRRFYGRFLFLKGELTEGRAQFNEALQILTELGENDRVKWERMWTLLEWSSSAHGRGTRSEALEKLTQAENIVKSIASEKMKEDARTQILPTRIKDIRGTQ